MGGGGKLFVQVMETFKTVLGPEHPDTLMSMWSLSHTLKELYRYAEALSLLQACVRLQNRRLDPYRYTVDATADGKILTQSICLEADACSIEGRPRSNHLVDMYGRHL